MSALSQTLEVPETFVADVVAQLERMAARAAAASTGRGRVSALEVTARYLRALVASSSPQADIDRLAARGLMTGEGRAQIKIASRGAQAHSVPDALMAALYAAGGSAPQYSPGGWQNRFLAAMGVEFDGYTDPRTVLEQLTAYAVRDRLGVEAKRSEDAAASIGSLQELRESVAASDALLAEARNRVESLQAELSALRGSLDAQAGELMEKDATIEFLRLLTGATDTQVAEAGNGRKPRRTVIKGETGIYRTDTGVIEVGWTEDKKQRWEILGDVSVDEARAFRAEKTGQPEAVAA
jgi:hypothetical protein